MEIDNKTRNKAILIIVIIAIAVLSLTKLTDKFTDVNTYSKEIAILDSKKETVFSLSTAATSASLLISIIPDDIGTPIANQLADISGYLLIILSIIYFEKYLLTIIGFAVFRFILPILCLICLCYVIFTDYQNKDNYIFIRFVSKITLFSLVLICIIPSSVHISSMIDETYKTSINNTVEDINNNEASDNSIISFTAEISNKIKNWINNFIEYTAVMIVTSCLIPLATLFVFAWLTNIIVGSNIIQPKLGYAKNMISNSIQSGEVEAKKIISKISDK